MPPTSNIQHPTTNAAGLRPLSLPGRGEYYAHRKWDLHLLSRWSQTPGLLIDPEQRHITRALVGGEQISPRRIDGEVARRLALRGGILDRGQRPLRGVDRKHGNTILPTVRSVEEAAVAIHLDF